MCTFTETAMEIRAREEATRMLFDRPDIWQTNPFLCLFRYTTESEPRPWRLGNRDLGFIHKDNKTKVIIGCFDLFNLTRGKHYGIIQYDSLEAMMEDGWLVD